MCISYVCNLENVLVFRGVAWLSGVTAVTQVKTAAAAVLRWFNPLSSPTPECPEVVKAPLDQGDFL